MLTGQINWLACPCPVFNRGLEKETLSKRYEMSVIDCGSASKFRFALSTASVKENQPACRWKMGNPLLMICSRRLKIHLQARNRSVALGQLHLC